ncbi:hypothetical protein BHE74_00009763 [Ensete ventricosum]|nr:hypothetical protein BHE74_00009763 [Ensete ventricosum]
MAPPGPHGVKNAYCLLNFGDSITTDHISPAGSIHKDSPAAKYLIEHGVDRRDFNSYGSRRGNDEIMARGTFANIRLVNKLLKGEVGPKTIHIPTGDKLYVFEVATRYKADGHDTIVLAGAEYGSGSSRDWAAKGPMLLGVKAVIAKSFERIHRSNLVGMGIIPLCFKPGEDAETLGLTGHERYTIDIPSSITDIRPGQDITVVVDNGKSFTCTLRFDTEVNFLLDCKRKSTEPCHHCNAGRTGLLQSWRNSSICHQTSDKFPPLSLMFLHCAWSCRYCLRSGHQRKL